MAPIGADKASRTSARRATPTRSLRSLGRSALVLSLALAGSASAGDDDDGPELTRPSAMPGAAPVVSAPPVQDVPKPVAKPGRRAVLAIPGLTSTPSRAAATTSPAESSSPSLDGPLEMPSGEATSRPAFAPLPAGRTGSPSEDSSTLDVDSIPEPIPSRSGSTTSRGSVESRRLDPLPDSTPARPTPTPAPGPVQGSRRGRFFGFLPGQAPAPGATLARNPARSASSSAPGLAEAGDAKAEPNQDANLRRRIEAQARAVVGDRTRSVEVRVVGKSAVIQARGVKFYQKRAVRKSLESLPAITGLRTTIEVND